MSRRHGAILVVLCWVLFLDGLDISLVGVALPSIKRDLGLGDSQLQWIVSGYVLGYGGLLLLGGRTADLLGRQRTLLVALGVFALASLAGGVTSSGAPLAVNRQRVSSDLLSYQCLRTTVVLTLCKAPTM